jgi:hypothetical protein
LRLVQRQMAEFILFPAAAVARVISANFHASNTFP